MKPFDPTKPYCRRDGLPAKIVYTYSDGRHIVVMEDLCECYHVWRDGRYFTDMKTGTDLVNIPCKEIIKQCRCRDCDNCKATELTDEQINKRLHELMGLCWHIDNTEWDGFGILWTWLQKHERWEEFWLKRLEGVARSRSETIMGMCQLISPPILSRAIVKFFEETHD